MTSLLKLVAVVFLGCALFLVVDVGHRVTGYQTAHGKGIRGTVTVTGCAAHRTGTFCVGDFTSADGRVVRSKIRVNGAAELLKWSGGSGRPAAVTRIPAALSAPGAGEAWTLAGRPWLRPSLVQVTALAPVATVLAMIWALVRGGPRSWRYRLDRARMRRGSGVVRREMALARMARRGRVN
jgi:hypothetical protein